MDIHFIKVNQLSIDLEFSRSGTGVLGRRRSEERRFLLRAATLVECSIVIPFLLVRELLSQV